jgi:hypothetical protein
LESQDLVNVESQDSFENGREVFSARENVADGGKSDEASLCYYFLGGTFT